MGTIKKSVKKAKVGDQVKPTADSTSYYSKKLIKSYGEKDFEGAKKASANVARQSKKGKPGYDANGFPIKKSKDGSSLKPVADDQKGLKALSTAVRNKMGYQKNGGKLKKQAAKAIAMKKAGKSPKKAMGGMKMMMGGGKCKYGC